MAVTQKERIEEYSQQIKDKINELIGKSSDYIELFESSNGYHDCKNTSEFQSYFTRIPSLQDMLELVNQKANSFDPHLAYPELFELVDQADKEMDKELVSINAMFEELERLLKGEKIQ